MKKLSKILHLVSILSCFIITNNAMDDLRFLASLAEIKSDSGKQQNIQQLLSELQQKNSATLLQQRSTPELEKDLSEHKKQLKNLPTESAFVTIFNGLQQISVPYATWLKMEINKKQAELDRRTNSSTTTTSSSSSATLAPDSPIRSLTKKPISILKKKRRKGKDDNKRPEKKMKQDTLSTNQNTALITPKREKN